MQISFEILEEDKEKVDKVLEKLQTDAYSRDDSLQLIFFSGMASILNKEFEHEEKVKILRELSFSEGKYTALKFKHFYMEKDLKNLELILSGHAAEIRFLEGEVKRLNSLLYKT